MQYNRNWHIPGRNLRASPLLGIYDFTIMNLVQPSRLAFSNVHCALHIVQAKGY